MSVRIPTIDQPMCPPSYSYIEINLKPETRTYHRSSFLLDLLDHTPILSSLRIKRGRLLRVPSDPDERSVAGSIPDIRHIVEEGDFEGVGV